MLSNSDRFLKLRSLATRIAVVASLTLSTSGLSFLAQIEIARRFGTGIAVDAYLFAISVPLFVAGLCTAAMSYALVPALVKLDANVQARRELLRSLVIACVLGTALMALFGTVAPMVQPFLLPAGSAIKAAPQLPVLIFCAWLSAGSQICQALLVIQLNSTRRPIRASLIPVLPNVTALAAIFVFGRYGLLVLPIGTTIGSLAAAATGFWLLRGSFACENDTGGVVALSPLAQVLRPTMAAVLAMISFTFGAVIDAYWAPRAGTGVLASLGFAQRLLIGVGGLFLAGPSAILIPQLAAHIGAGDYAGFRRTTRLSILAVAGGAAAASIAIWVGAEAAVRLAFGHGAFSAADVGRVSGLIRGMLPGFGAMMLSVITTRALFCLPDAARVAAGLGIIWPLAYFVTCGLLIGLKESGFAISYSICWAGLAMLSLLAIELKTPRLRPEISEAETWVPMPQAPVEK